MVVNTLMYAIFIIAGLIGSAIAWDDLVKPKNKDDQKAESAAK